MKNTFLGSGDQEQDHRRNHLAVQIKLDEPKTISVKNQEKFEILVKNSQIRRKILETTFFPRSATHCTLIQQYICLIRVSQ